MSNRNKRMSSDSFRGRFWMSVIGVYLIAFVFFGTLSLWSVLSQRDTLNLRRFQYDFFAALSGQEEKMKYGREDALQIAKILRSIPPERRNEDLSDMLTLALAKTEAKNLRDQLAAKDFSKLERLSLYASFLQYGDETYNEDWRDTFLDVNTRLAIVSVLEGNPAPVIEGTEGSLFFHRNTWFLIILITQLFAFLIYSLACLTASFWRQYYSDNFNPLFDLPEGSGPKRSFLVTFPGCIPVMFVIMLFSGPKRLQEAFARRRESRGKINLPFTSSTESTQKALARLREKVGKGRKYA